MIPRYSVDQVGPYELAIFDSVKRGTPIVYMLYVIQISGTLNYQLILTSYDAKIAATRLPVFEEEIYSVKFFSRSDQLNMLINNILYVLASSDIENPEELVRMFGGSIRSKPYSRKGQDRNNNP